MGVKEGGERRTKKVFPFAAVLLVLGKFMQLLPLDGQLALMLLLLLLVVLTYCMAVFGC